jgi:hypothetical protein
LPTVSVTALDPDANADGPDGKPQAGYFDFHRTGDPIAALTASVSDTGTTAIAGTDYSGSLPTTVTFNAGQQDVIVPVAPTSSDPDLSSIADASIAAGGDYANATGEAELDLVGAGPTVKLGDGSDNIVLQGSDTGNTNAQQLAFTNYPTALPSGATLQLVPSVDARSDLAFWNGNPASGNATQLSLNSAGNITLHPGTTAPNIWVGATQGSQAVNDIYFTVAESVPASGGAPALARTSSPSNGATAEDIEIMYNGVDIAGDSAAKGNIPTVVVGEPVHLTANVELPAGSEADGFTWTAGLNAIGGYTLGPENNSGSIDPIENNVPYTTLYWVAGGTESVDLQVLKDGAFALPTQLATFNVVEPTASIKTQVSATKVQQFPVAVPETGAITWPSFKLGLIPSETDPAGITFGATFTPTNTPLPGHPGTFSWVQITTQRLWIMLPHDNTWGNPIVQTGLDNSDPYAGSNPDGSAEDAPLVGNNAANVAGYDEDTSDVMYYMFQSRMPGSIPVPLKEVDWGWHGAVIVQTGGKWKLVDPSPAKTPGDLQPKVPEPTWSNVVKNVEH